VREFTLELERVLYTTMLMVAAVLGFQLLSRFSHVDGAMGVLTVAGLLLYLLPAVVTEVKRLDYGFVKILVFFSLLPGTLFLLAHLTGYLGTNIHTLLSFAAAGAGCWLWMGWLYASRATKAYRGDKLDKAALGYGITAVFTGMLLGLLLLGTGAFRAVYWARIAGVILMAAAVLALLWLYRQS
jgi:hypothetical protein